MKNKGIIIAIGLFLVVVALIAVILAVNVSRKNTRMALLQYYGAKFKSAKTDRDRVAIMSALRQESQKNAPLPTLSFSTSAAVSSCDGAVYLMDTADNSAEWNDAANQYVDNLCDISWHGWIDDPNEWWMAD